jgi:hypothetical protein
VSGAIVVSRAGAAIVALTCGLADGAVTRLAAVFGAGACVRAVGQYAFDGLALEQCGALLVSMHADQRFLAARRDRLDTFVRRGGTVVANGHVAYPFLSGLAPFQPIENYRLADLAVNRERPHPIWEGVDPQDLTFRRGVAGFYGRGWHQPPEGAAVHSSLGRRRLPLDFTYRLGQGRVLFHGGNDIWQFSSEGDSTRRIVPQLVGWLLSAEPTA